MSAMTWALPSGQAPWKTPAMPAALRTLARVLGAEIGLLAFAYGLRTCSRGLRMPGSAVR